MAADKVQLLKQESTAGGGDGTEEREYPAPLDPNEDLPEVRGVYFQKDTGNDTAVKITRDASDNLSFTDPVAGTKTLQQLATAAGVSVNDFLLDNEPVDVGYTYTPTYSGGVVTQEEWKITSNNRKRRTIDYTYSGGSVSTEVRKVYDPADGTTVLAQVTITYTYSGSIVSSAAYVRNV